MSWVALLFGVMALGTMMCVKSSENLADSLGDPREAIGVFQRRATDCLLIAKYSSQPGAYTMEALLMNAQNEFLRRRDAHLGVWVLGGIAIRLAMRMGYRESPDVVVQLVCYKFACLHVGTRSLTHAPLRRPRSLSIHANLTLRG